VVTIRVPLIEQRDASYDILIGPGLVGGGQLDTILRERCPAEAYAVISDSHVGKIFGEDLTTQLSAAGHRAELFTFPAGEWHKTRDTWASLSDRMLAAHFGRDCAVIALGGGVANDVGGFVAASTAHIDEADSATMHGFLVWALFVVLLVLMIALGAGAALGSAGGVLSTSVDKLTPDQIQTAGWGTVFALAIALASSILGALLATRPGVRDTFARR
jgi:hypothetical protein